MVGSEIGVGDAVATGGTVVATGEGEADGGFDALGFATCAGNPHAAACITMVRSATDRRCIFFILKANAAGRHPI